MQNLVPAQYQGLWPDPPREHASRAVAARLWHILADRYRLPGRVALVIAADGARAAEKPGLDSVPQTADGL